MAILNLNEIPEIKAVEEGEYDLRIAKAFKKVYDSGAAAVCLIVEIVGEENADEIFHSIWLPTSADGDKKKMNKMRMIKDFLEGVGLPTDEFDDEELDMFLDVEFSAIVGQEPDYKDETKTRNIITRLT